MAYRSWVLVALAAAIALAPGGGSLVAQTKPQPAAKQPDTVNGRADSLKTIWGARKMVLMKGNVKFTHGDTTLTSAEINWDENEKVAQSPGKLTITDPECDITGDKGSGYFKKRLGVVEGNVVMQLKPQKQSTTTADDASVREKLNKPTTVTCKKIEYQYRTKVATATGGVEFRQTNRTASADSAVYDQKKELLTLKGNVKGIDEYGQTFAAPGTVRISLKEGDEWMEAESASASFKVDLDEEE